VVAVATGRLSPGGTPRILLEALRQDLIASAVEPLPWTNDLGACLSSMVEFRRINSGCCYAVEVTPRDAA
jgi:hypothetical protein